MIATRRPLCEAVEASLALRALFPPETFARWETAGSVRRKRPEVGDVEHVIIPATGEVAVGGGLFAEKQRVNLFHFHLDALVRGGQVRKALINGSPRWGDRYRRIGFAGLEHDLFFATADNWGATLAIRTGPAEFSKRLVTGLLPHGYRNDKGQVWRCEPCPYGPHGIGAKPECELCEGSGLVRKEVVPVATEREYFALAGVPFIEPEGRA